MEEIDPAKGKRKEVILAKAHTGTMLQQVKQNSRPWINENSPDPTGSQRRRRISDAPAFF
jgi:hypothetical protein